MEYITNQMSRPRWHPLPIDSQVVAAIQDRRDMLKQIYKQEVSMDTSTEDSWIWHHIFTVLDHAEKIFETPENDMKHIMEQWVQQQPNNE